ncbi:MAG: GTPase [Planctomycetota bacterium]
MVESKRIGLRADCEILTGEGRAAIAVVRLAGKDAKEVLEACFQSSAARPIEPGQVRYGHWTGPARGEDNASESVVVVPISASEVEVHCHGGSAAVARIVADMTDCGARAVASRDRSPLTSSPFDWLIADAESMLVRCTAKRPAAIAMDQVRGAMTRWCDQMVAKLSEDPSSIREVARQATELVAAGQVGARLDLPFDVVLAGPPNVGKSSLINAIVGFERSIATELAGTTRDVLDAETVFDGWPIRFRDTAGLRETPQEIESQGIELANAAIESADLLVIVGEPDAAPDESMTRIVDDMRTRKPVIEVLNKADRLVGETDVKLLTVATRGQGIENLCRTILDVLLAPLPEAGSAVPTSQKQIRWLQRVAEAGTAVEQIQLLQSTPSQDDSA